MPPAGLSMGGAAGAGTGRCGAWAVAPAGGGLGTGVPLSGGAGVRAGRLPVEGCALAELPPPALPVSMKPFNRANMNIAWLMRASRSDPIWLAISSKAFQM